MKSNVSHEIDNILEIDFYRGYRYFLGNMDNYKKALLAINKSVKSKIPLLQYMIKTGEYEGLRLVTQTLQVMMNNIGAKGLSEFSYEVEVILFNEDEVILNNLLREYVGRLEQFIDQLEPILKKDDMMNTLGLVNSTNSFKKYDFSKTRESIKLSQDYIERNII